MDSSLIVFHQVGVMALLIAIGLISVKKKLISTSIVKELSNILLYLVVPALLIRSYSKEIKKEELIGLGFAFLLSILFHIVAILISKIFKNNMIEKLGMIYSNCGFMAFPILSVVLGDKGVFYGAAFVAIFNIMIWTSGLKMLTGDKKLNLKKSILNPGCVAAFLGIITYCLQINYPKIVSDTMDFLAALNTPLAMLCIGVLLSKIKWKAILKDINLLKVTFIKNIFIPIIFILLIVVMHLPSINETARQVCITIILCGACPAASSISIIPASLDMDGERGAEIVAITTLFSIITLPLVSYITFKIL